MPSEKEPEVLKPQLWYCERCGVLGAVMYELHADVMSVVHAMGDHHREASPGCSNGPMGLMSIVPENIRKPMICRPAVEIPSVDRMTRALRQVPTFVKSLEGPDEFIQRLHTWRTEHGQALDEASIYGLTQLASKEKP